MNLKGAAIAEAVGKCVSVLYDEGGAELVAYRGVVVYTEKTRHAGSLAAPSAVSPPPCHATTADNRGRHTQGLQGQSLTCTLHPARAPGRMYVVFDDFDENEGAWVDDSDEWQWVPTPRTGLRAPLPVSGAWRPGVEAGPLEKIYLSRMGEDTGPMMLVKWKGMAHIHSQWVPQAALCVDANNKRSVQRYLKAEAAAASGGGPAESTWELEGEGDEGGRGGRTEEEPYNPEFEQLERVIAVMTQEEDDLPPKYLVKWRALPYASCTWESCRTLLDDQSAIRRYWASEAPPTPAEKRMAAQRSRPPKTSFQKLKESAVYKAGHGLRPYQLEGLNWLLFSWYNRRSVLLADEMGLGKTVQSVTTVNHIWKQENIRGPFLVLAPLSTLSHWQREFDGWTDMNTILYHGSNESRETLREFEFSYTDPALAGHCKFHTLITRCLISPSSPSCHDLL